MPAHNSKKRLLLSRRASYLASPAAALIPRFADEWSSGSSWFSERREQIERWLQNGSIKGCSEAKLLTLGRLDRPEADAKDAKFSQL